MPMPTAAGSAAPPTGKALYDALYSIGYHNKTHISHANELIKALKRLRNPHDINLSKIDSMLDIGCSHGMAVEKLWKLGLRANGVDVSDLAVQKARDTRKTKQNCHQQPCFQVASAALLPFANRSFDGIMSSDVLEHVQAEDVRLAVSELARVARSVLILKISNRPEGSVAELNALRHAREQRGEEGWSSFNLHATIQGPDYWLRLFEERGWYLHHMLEAQPHDTNYIKNSGIGLPWECCSYVLQPADAPRARATARAEMRSMRQQQWFSRANLCLHWKKMYCGPRAGGRR